MPYKRTEAPQRKARSAPRRRGGRRPGAGAPRGNINALRSGRYSQQFPHAAMLVAIIPRLTRELDLAYEQSPAIAGRRLKQYIAAADAFIKATPGLAEQIEVAIFTNRTRLPAIENAEDYLGIVIVKPQPDRLRRAIGFAGWLIKRDRLFEDLFTEMPLPPIRAHLKAQEEAARQAGKTIKPPEAPENEPD